MPKDLTAPSQNWNIQNQINQSQQINQEKNKSLDDYKKKTQALVTLDRNLSNLEDNGYDTTEDRKYYDLMLLTVHKFQKTLGHIFLTRTVD